MLNTFETLTIPDRCDTPDIVPAALALPTRTLAPNSNLYESDREAGSLYVVNYGVLKAVVPTSLGRDRIADLYGPGDVLGLSALDGGRHAETVTAVHDALPNPDRPKSGDERPETPGLHHDQHGPPVPAQPGDDRRS